MRDVHLLGIPMDLGAGRRGVDVGPSALRLARLTPTLERIGRRVVDHGNVPVAVPEATDDPERLAYVDAIAAAARATVDAAAAIPSDAVPVFLGGDHAVTIGTYAARAELGRTGVLWIDAHADLNTPSTSPSGNVHGMPAAVLMGEGDPRLVDVVPTGARLDPRDLVYVGLRSVDPAERALVTDRGIRTFTMTDVDRRGIADVAEAAAAHLAHVDRLHVSFDADVLDPDLAPGVGTPVPGGLSYREAHLLMEILAATDLVTSVDLVEDNPMLDDRNRTADIVVEMAASLLGKTIL